jgi:cytochrome b6-f complex iron-sulfur subunit
MMRRREFLNNLGFGTFVAAMGSVIAMFARFLTPNIVTSRGGPVEIEMPGEYSIGSLNYVERARAYVGQDQGGYYAFLAVCTHLGCTPRLEGTQFVCPCHGSRFDSNGEVISGPARRPLERIFMGRAANGKLFLDTSRTVDVNFRLKGN